VTSATAPSRRRLPRDERGRQLLDIAEDLIASRGIQATSMTDIAERAGVTKPVVYDHFGSKDGLVAAIVLRAGHELAGTLLAAVEGAPDAESALAAGVRSYFEFMAGRRASWAALLTETATDTTAAEALEQVRRDQATLIAELVSADVPGCDLDQATLYAQVVVGGCERLVTYTATTREVSPETLTRHVMDAMWRGFADIREGRRWSGGDPDARQLRD
jgi:AcrR family transcriptional regulator